MCVKTWNQKSAQRSQNASRVASTRMAWTRGYSNNNSNAVPSFIMRGNRMYQQVPARRNQIRQNQDTDLMDPIEEMPEDGLVEIPDDGLVEIPIGEVPDDGMIEIPVGEIPDDGMIEIPVEEIPDEELPGEEIPDEELPVDEQPIDEEPEMPVKSKCSWGPSYYCQSENIFSTCRPNSNFEGECKLIRDGMLAKCEDLGKRFWCSSEANFNYCVVSQGYTGDMADFGACKPSRVGGKGRCKNCGKVKTQIYNIYACNCKDK